MYPIFYQRKTRTGFLIALLLLALSIRVVCESELRRAVWDRTRAVLGSETLFINPTPYKWYDISLGVSGEE